MVPSVYWAHRDGQVWDCRIVEFIPAHMFPRSSTACPAFKLFEISAEETFFMKYPDPYLVYRSSAETRQRSPELFITGACASLPPGLARACKLSLVLLR